MRGLGGRSFQNSKDAVSPTWLWYLPVPLDAVSDVSKRYPSEANGSIFCFSSFFVGFLSGTVWVIEPGLTGVLSLFTTESSQLLLIGCLEEPFGSDLNPNL